VRYRLLWDQLRTLSCLSWTTALGSSRSSSKSGHHRALSKRCIRRRQLPQRRQFSRRSQSRSRVVRCSLQRLALRTRARAFKKASQPMLRATRCNSLYLRSKHHLQPSNQWLCLRRHPSLQQLKQQQQHSSKLSQRFQ
jgi:hypothetical protein